MTREISVWTTTEMKGAATAKLEQPNKTQGLLVPAALHVHVLYERVCVCVYVTQDARKEKKKKQLKMRRGKKRNVINIYLYKKKSK